MTSCYLGAGCLLLAEKGLGEINNITVWLSTNHGSVEMEGRSGTTTLGLDPSIFQEGGVSNVPRKLIP